MNCLKSPRHRALTGGTVVAAVVLAMLCLPSLAPSAGAQTRSPADVMQMRKMTKTDILAKVRRRQTTPISQKLSAGEVGTVNDQEVKCFKKRSSGLVQVKCPDIMIVETK